MHFSGAWLKSVMLWLSSKEPCLHVYLQEKINVVLFCYILQRPLAFISLFFLHPFQELRAQCQKFATALLDHTRSSTELEILLNHDPTGPVYQHGDRMHLNRLKLAIKYRQKKVRNHFLNVRKNYFLYFWHFRDKHVCITYLIPCYCILLGFSEE